MQRNTLWTIAAAATVAGALATLPAAPDAIGAGLNGTTGARAYRCYPVSATKVPAGSILVGSDEIGPFNVTLGKAKSYCTVADLGDDDNNTLITAAPLACFATKDLQRPALPPGGIVINVTVDHVGALGLKLKKSKLTCLPAVQMGM